MKITRQHRKFLSNAVKDGYELVRHYSNGKLYWGGYDTHLNNHPTPEGPVLKALVACGLMERSERDYRITERGKSFRCRNCQNGEIFNGVDDKPLHDCPVCEGYATVLDNKELN